MLAGNTVSKTGFPTIHSLGDESNFKHSAHYLPSAHETRWHIQNGVYKMTVFEDLMRGNPNAEQQQGKSFEQLQKEAEERSRAFDDELRNTPYSRALRRTEALRNADLFVSFDIDHNKELSKSEIEKSLSRGKSSNPEDVDRQAGLKMLYDSFDNIKGIGRPTKFIGEIEGVTQDDIDILVELSTKRTHAQENHEFNLSIAKSSFRELDSNNDGLLSAKEIRFGKFGTTSGSKSLADHLEAMQNTQNYFSSKYWSGFTLEEMGSFDVGRVTNKRDRQILGEAAQSTSEATWSMIRNAGIGLAFGYFRGGWKEALLAAPVFAATTAGINYIANRWTVNNRLTQLENVLPQWKGKIGQQ